MNRIDGIAKMVKSGMVLADIGTDHAFLPIQLVQTGICPKAYACDITEGPLAIAKRNISAAGLDGKIKTILSDGFDQVPKDTQCVVIAGMGGHTIIGILERAENRLQDLKQIVVEANNDSDALRHWISSKGYTITDEVMIHDRNHDYASISFTSAPHAPYTEEEQLLGPVLMAKRSPEFISHCIRMKEKLDMILSHRHDAVLEKHREWYAAYTK